MGILVRPVHHALTYTLVAVAALAVVFWIGLAYWVNRDARRRIRRTSLVVLATLVSLVPCVGPLLYLLFRPAETRADVRSRNAELAALEAHVARHRPACPKCRGAVEADFLICPICATRLREPCARCNAPLERLWHMCPYCATPVETRPDFGHVLDEALTREVRSTTPALDLVAEATPTGVEA